MNVPTSVGLTIIGLTVATVGCENTREGLEKDARANAPKVERAAEQTAAATKEAAREVSEAAAPAVAAIREGTAAAAQVAKEGMRGAAKAADAAQQTAQIKSALMADTTIDSTGIDVDTNANTKTVTLRGRVATAAQKTRAAQIATDKAPGYTVTNNLQVGR